MFKSVLDAARRRSGGAFPDAGQDADTRFQVAAGNVFDQFVTQLLRCLKDALQHARSPLLQMHGLATPVRGGALALDPSVLLEPIENAGKRRSFYADAIRDLTLRQLIAAASEMRQRGPLAHTQTERAQALVQLRPPGAGGFVEKETKSFDFGRSRQESLAC